MPLSVYIISLILIMICGFLLAACGDDKDKQLKLIITIEATSVIVLFMSALIIMGEKNEQETALKNNFNQQNYQLLDTQTYQVIQQLGDNIKWKGRGPNPDIIGVWNKKDSVFTIYKKDEDYFILKGD